MAKFLITAAMALMGLFMNAQVSQTRNVTGFKSISVQNGISIIYTQGTAPQVTVSAATQTDADNIITERNGQTLKIFMKTKEEGYIATKEYKDVKVYITANNIEEFSASTGASIKTSGEVSGSAISVYLTSGGSFTGEINCTNKFMLSTKSGSVFKGKVTTNIFEGDFRNGSAINIYGSANIASLYVASGATVMGERFLTKTAKVDAKNTAAVYITVLDSINAYADSSASVTYFGNPAETSINKNSYAVKKN